MRRVLVLAVAAALLGAAEASAQTRLDQRPRDRVVLTTPGYTLAIAKRNGAFLHLTDRASRKRLWRGSKNGCLWYASAPDARQPYVAGCGAASFRYRWNARAATLTLTWTDPRAVATATIVAGRRAIDLRLTLENKTGTTIERVYLPSDLILDSASVRAGYAPSWLPGVRLSREFFSRRSDAVFTYPSRWSFVDWLAVDLDGGALALYTVNPPPAPIAPSFLGFLRTPAPDRCAEPVFCIRHAYETWVRDGATWTSPLVRILVGEPVERSLAAYRRDNRIDEYAPLATKVGARLDTLARAPLIKADLWKGLLPFTEWLPDLRRLPSPALLHPVGYQRGGHDSSHPDFLPPDLRWGTTDDLNAMLAAARSLGLLSMPYLNVSWWSEEAVEPALAVQDEAGTPALERYNERAGYAVSPFVRDVRDRVAKLLEQWRTDVPVDCLFFDQVGARPWRLDFNPAAPTPLAYYDGWIALLEPYKQRCLMVEDGWDRLASTFAGFHGSLLMGARWDEFPDMTYGRGNWEPFPLATWLLHDKVLMYHHDLYEDSMVHDLEVLKWNAAFGIVGSYNWDGYLRTLDSPWLDAAGAFQQALGPRYAGKPLASYEVEGGVSETVFGELRVQANWGTRQIDIDGYGLPRQGWLARGPNLVAGTFSGAFGGRPLAGGTHVLFVENRGGAVWVRKPIGGEARLSVEAGGSRLRAFDAQGRLLRDVAAERRDGRVEFLYAAAVDDRPVAYYVIS